MLANDETLSVLDRRIQAYTDFGWVVVERQVDPVRVRLAYRRGSRKFAPAQAEGRDTGERFVWADEAGEVQVKRVAHERTTVS